jgi:putative nucleotidyltransferase with HDIG domain
VSTVPPDPRPARPIVPRLTGVLPRIGRWLRTIVELNERPSAERDEFQHPPRWLRRILTASLVIDAAALTRLPVHDVAAVAALTVIYSLTMLVPPVPSPLGMIRTPRVAFLVTLMLLWSPLDTLIAIAFGTILAVSVFRLYEFWRATINSVFWAYPAAFASLVGHTARHMIPGRLVGLIAASLIILIVYLLGNFALLALYRHLRYREPFFSYWWSCLTENPLAQVLAAPLPILLGAAAFGLGGALWMALLLTSLSAITMPASRAQLAVYLASQRTMQDIVQALMIALERTVPGAQAHAERVGELVGAIGRRLGVPAATLESWRTAALLHDIGLIDADSRRAPPARHAAVGARILASYPDTIVADIVREHHTPWTAVSRRLRGAAVLGARVLAAAEYYDELRYGVSGTAGLATHAATAAALRPLIGPQIDPHLASVLFDAAERLEPKAKAS